MEKSGLYWGEGAGNGDATGDERQPSPKLHPHPHYIYIYIYTHIFIWLGRVLIAAHRNFIVACGLRCLEVCGILVP